jgi:radical SAM superfamily enzyme YgiQ (UPF0313 family)
MGPLQSDTTMLEFVINDITVDVLAAILDLNPKIVGLGIYIWNVEPMTRLVADLKRVRPEIVIVLGGPEISYEAEGQPIVEMADYVISGEADCAFRELCTTLLSGNACHEKLIRAAVPTFDQLALPYDFYDDADVANRVIYVEVSRGCPFTCEFCLSSLDIPVRLANVEQFLSAMQKLLDRGAKQFKFVDRTFNLNLRVSRQILQFFLDRLVPGLFLHFEMIPDRLPEDLRKLIAQFPPGALQFEIGVQTFNDEVGKLISRKQDNDKLADNFHYLRHQTGVHIHADLIIGLPGESLESFAAGFDRLYALRPQEIQVGILKRLRGTPITRHDDTWEMKYSPHPPYEILSNRLLSFDDIHRLRRFARYWDLVGNSGNFVESLNLVIASDRSAFTQFADLCDWLHSRHPSRYGISLADLFKTIFEYLLDRYSVTASQMVAETMWEDYVRGGRRDRPAFLKPYELRSPQPKLGVSLPQRQARHVTQ